MAGGEGFLEEDDMGVGIDVQGFHLGQSGRRCVVFGGTAQAETGVYGG